MLCWFMYALRSIWLLSDCSILVKLWCLGISVIPFFVIDFVTSISWFLWNTVMSICEKNGFQLVCFSCFYFYIETNCYWNTVLSAVFFVSMLYNKVIHHLLLLFRCIMVSVFGDSTYPYHYFYNFLLLLIQVYILQIFWVSENISFYIYNN